MWSAFAEKVVAGLIRKSSGDAAAENRATAARLGALYVGSDFWTSYYLRPNGEVVKVGEDLDRPDEAAVYSDRATVLGTLVWGARSFPELRALLPERESWATDCPCRKYPDMFGPDRGIICQDCSGLGWLPVRPSAEPAPTPERAGGK
jgi:hypothetical protein